MLLHSPEVSGMRGSRANILRPRWMRLRNELVGEAADRFKMDSIWENESQFLYPKLLKGGKTLADRLRTANQSLKSSTSSIACQNSSEPLAHGEESAIGSRERIQKAFCGLQVRFPCLRKGSDGLLIGLANR